MLKHAFFYSLSSSRINYRFIIMKKLTSLFSVLLLVIFLSSCHNTKKPVRKSSKARVERKRLPKKETKKTTTKPLPANTLNKRKSRSTELNSFIKNWEGSPHKMGGNTKKGVDCSGFVIQVYAQVYNDQFNNRRARDLYLETIPIKKTSLKEGDLVFFKIGSSHINHIGIYLRNGDFVHVSSKKGVMVSNLNEVYFKKYFFAGGRKK